MDHWNKIQHCMLVGAGFAILLKLKGRTRLHPIVSERCIIVDRSPTIATVLSNLATVTGDNLIPILNKVEDVFHLDRETKLSNQWRIARLNGDIMRDLGCICSLSNSALANDQLFADILFARRQCLFNNR